jgi:hypothetical protein
MEIRIIIIRNLVEMQEELAVDFVLFLESEK